MTDLFDKASELEAIERDAALGAHQARRSADRQQHADAGAPCDCVSCGEPIPKARRAAVPEAIRCVLCQARHDKTHRNR